MANRLLVSCALLATGTVMAAPSAPPNPAYAGARPPAASDPSQQAACAPHASSAITHVACTLAAGLNAVEAPVILAAAPLAADVEVRKSDALLERVLRVLAGRIGPSARVLPQPQSLSSARAAAPRGTRVVYVQAELQRGELRAVADVYAQTTFWARLREGEGASEAHAFANARLDAELRSFLVPAPLVARAEVRVPLPERPILAVSCEDVTGTGALELVLVGRRAIHVGVVREQRFVSRKSTPWSDHSPVAPTPVQEPLVSVAVRAGQELLVGSTDRAQTLRFSPELTALGKSGRALPWPSGGCSRIDGVTLAGNVAPCFEGDRDGPRWAASFPTETAAPPAPASTAPVLRGADALASTRWVDREGRWRAARALRESSSSEVRVLDSEGRVLRLPRRGAQLALGDVDADGDLEILTSLDVLDPARDELVIESWRANGRAEERKRVPVPSGVRALAACPSDDSARSARLAVATGNELWILR